MGLLPLLLVYVMVVLFSLPLLPLMFVIVVVIVLSSLPLFNPNGVGIFVVFQVIAYHLPVCFRSLSIILIILLIIFITIIYYSHYNSCFHSHSYSPLHPFSLTVQPFHFNHSECKTLQLTAQKFLCILSYSACECTRRSAGWGAKGGKGVRGQLYSMTN